MHNHRTEQEIKGSLLSSKMNVGQGLQGKPGQEARRMAAQRWENVSLVDAMKYRRLRETRRAATSAVPLATHALNSLLTLDQPSSTSSSRRLVTSSSSSPISTISCRPRQPMMAVHGLTSTAQRGHSTFRPNGSNYSCSEVGACFSTNQQRRNERHRFLRMALNSIALQDDTTDDTESSYEESVDYPY